MAEPFRYETRVRFADTDATARIHYTALFRFFEAAETELFRTLDVSYARGTLSFPRVHAECDIKLALVYDDAITIETRVTKLGNSSVRLAFRAIKQGQVAATGAIVAVCIDKKTERPVRIPDEVRARFEAILAVEE